MKPNILVLDDDSAILDEICETLSDDGFETLRAENSAELWALTEKHTIDLFILDLGLPGENGLDVAKDIRQQSNVGIIIVTAKSSEADRVVGLDMGADDYITKPFNPRELLSRVRSVLRRTKGNTYPDARKASGDEHEQAVAAPVPVVDDVVQGTAGAPRAPATEEKRVLGRVVLVSGAQVTGVLHRSDNPHSPSGGVRMGALVKMRTSESDVFGIVTGLRAADAAFLTENAAGMVEVELLCEVMDGPEGSGNGTFKRGVSVYPGLDTDIVTATPEELARIYARPAASNVRVGTIHQDRNLPAFLLTDELLGKHFAILGTTGSGKSCSVALILHAILSEHRNGRIVMLDPHNEYASAFEGMAEVLNPSTLELPYWLLNFEETVGVVVGPDRPEREPDIAILKSAILECKMKYLANRGESHDITIDTPVPYRYGDLIRTIDREMGAFDKADSTAPYLRLKARLEALRADKRYGFMFSGYKVEDTMASVLSRLLRIPVSGKPVAIVDLSGVPSDIVDALVSVLCRMIFDFAMWTDRAEALPVLLVCEEAHRYVPSDAAAGFAPTRRSIARIAREGRKYGVSLCLVSQRPSELDPAILSQCSTLFALRMSNERDHQFVRHALPESALGLLAALSSLKVQEAIVVGEGVTVPVRLTFDSLDEARRPRSASAAFSTAWQSDVEDDGIVERTMERWRRQAL
jgi:hypothetical protein